MLGKFSEKVKGFGRGVWGLMVVIFSIGFALTVILSSIIRVFFMQKAAWKNEESKAGAKDDFIDLKLGDDGKWS